MSISKKIQFFWLDHVFRDQLRVLEILLVAQRTASQIDPSIHQILIR